MVRKALKPKSKRDDATMYVINKKLPSEWSGRTCISSQELQSLLKKKRGGLGFHKQQPVPDKDRMTAEEYRQFVNGNNKPKRRCGPKPRTNPREDFATYDDGVLKVVIHEIPPSQNEWKKWHKLVLAEFTKVWNTIICTKVQEIHPPLFRNPVIKFYFFVPNAMIRDRKNLESWKPLLDGLTEAGVISDDNYLAIKEDPSDIEIDRDNPRTEIVVYELDKTDKAE